MADDDIVKNFLIFLLEMSIEFCIMFQYNIKFQIYCNYLSKLKKKKKEKNKIEKVTISQISTFYVYMLFWNRAFQMWSMKPETRTKPQLQGFLTLLITKIEGSKDRRDFFSSLFAQVLYNYFLNTSPCSST